MKIKTKITRSDFKLKLKNWGRKVFVSPIFRFILLIIVLLTVNYFSENYFTRLDLTSNKQYSLTDSTKDMLTSLDDKVEITVFMSDNIPPEFLPMKQNILDLLTEYNRFGGDNLTVFIKDPNAEAFKDEAAEVGMYESQFPSISEDSYEIARGYFGLYVQYQEGFDSIPLIWGDRLEYDLSSMIHQLTVTERNSVGYLIGHGERDLMAEYYEVSLYMQKQYNLVSVDLSAGEPIDASVIKTLVIVDPSENLTERDMFELDQYMMSGGNIIVLADSYISNFETGTLVKKEINLNKFLNRYGLNLDDNLMADKSSTPVEGYLEYPYWVLAQPENINTDIPVLNKLDSATFLWGSSVSVVEVSGLQTYTSLVASTPYAWATSDDIIPLSLESIGAANNRHQATLAAMISGTMKSYYIDESVPVLETENDDLRSKDIERFEEGSEGHLILFGDSDFVTDAFMLSNEQNDDIFLNLVDWLSDNQSLADIRVKDSKTLPIMPLSNEEKLGIRFFIIGALPLLMIGLGIVVNVVRSKKKSKLL